MSCHICSRAPNPRLPFCCATCARSHLYQLRVEHAKILLEKEAIGKQIEDAIAHIETRGIAGETDGMVPESATQGHSCWTIQAIANRQATSSARTKALRDRVETMVAEINDKKLDISQRRLTLARRNSDTESAKYQLLEREAAMLTAIQNNARRTEHLWHTLHTKTTDARVFLCREAANIYGLRQKSKRINGDSKETYVLGGAAAAHISTAFSNIAHLLVLISHYLSLRLPAEITLPHRDYPTATIYAPARSYLSRELSSSSPAQSSSSGPAASRTPGPRHYAPRPRPLFIDRSLPKLAREDPRTYALFLEGATLLAWNVSWLCRTQGLNLTSDSWEEVCDIGKNIWQLSVAPPVQASTLMKAYASRDIPSKSRGSKDSLKTTIQRTKTFSMLGHYSHGTSHSFLGASEGTEFMRTWKLPTPTKVVDKLKSTLLGEMASAEWELLEEKEWDAEAQEPPQPLQGSRVPIEQSHGHGLGPERNGSTHTTLTGAGISRNEDAKPESANEPTSTGRSKGTSGWTKLRNR